MKVCSECGEDKPYSAFVKRYASKDGLDYRCRACKNEYQRKYRQRPEIKERQRLASAAKRDRNKKFLVGVLNESDGCMDCHNTDIRVLEWDHVRGKKEANISSLVSKGYNIVVIQKEMDKCDIVCANCHRIRSGDTFGYYKNGKGLPAAE